MEPEIEPALPEAQQAEILPSETTSLPAEPSSETAPPIAGMQPASPQPEPGSNWLAGIFVDSNGLLRSGWSIAIYIPLMLLVSGLVGAVLLVGHTPDKTGIGGPWKQLLFGVIEVAGVVGAAALVALIERRPKNLLEYNLLGPRRGVRFLTGLIAGFAALSVLVGALKAGGWLALAPSELPWVQIARYAVLWGITFLLVACNEEGLFRGFLQATLTRGLNLWWALGLEAAVSGLLLWRGKGNGVWGVYAIVLLGLGPCLWLVWKRAPSTGFWLAAWVTSTLFGLAHTGNDGENWIGIFAAAAIGFVFVVSVRVTGSVWWALGFHAAWDWTETFFYGTADSGLQAHGSLLVAKPTGNAFWSGGADGPEGSVLVLAVILLVLAALVAVYGRKRTAEPQEIQPA